MRPLPRRGGAASCPPGSWRASGVSPIATTFSSPIGRVIGSPIPRCRGHRRPWANRCRCSSWSSTTASRPDSPAAATRSIRPATTGGRSTHAAAVRATVCGGAGVQLAARWRGAAWRPGAGRAVEKAQLAAALARLLLRDCHLGAGLACLLSADRTLQQVEFANGVRATFNMAANELRVENVPGFSGEWEQPEQLG